MFHDETLHQLGWLFASIAVLGAGPLLHRLSRSSPRTTSAIGLAIGLFTVVLIGLHVLPECVAEAGGAALFAAGLGFALPMLFEHRLRGITHGATPWLAALALAVHAATDGLALAGAHVGDAHAHGIELAVILHRLAFEAALWWFLLPRGRLVAFGALGLIAASTVLGFFTGKMAIPLLSDDGVLFQAFVGGLVLHAMMHRPVAKGFDGVLPWALAAFFSFAAIQAVIVEDHGALGIGLALAGLAALFVASRMSGHGFRTRTR